MMKIHPKFKLNGASYQQHELIGFANELFTKGEEFEKSLGKFIIDWLSDANSIEVRTSGSTGLPKTISLKKAHMVNSAQATAAYFDLQPEQKALLCLPTEFIAGKMMLVRAMVLGLDLDYVEPSSKPLESLDKTFDFAAMVPFQVENSIPKLTYIKTLIVGGAAVSKALKKKIRGLSTQVFETYGMTETITHIALKNLSGSVNENRIGHFESLPGVTLTIDDRSCLVIHAPSISDQDVITNDVVELISSTQFKWLGRYDHIINSGGVKLIPEEIERKLSGLINNRFFVFGIPDDQLGQKVVLFVEGLKQEQLLNIIKKEKILNKYEVPKQIVFLDHFEETNSSKIHRKKTVTKAL